MFLEQLRTYFVDDMGQSQLSFEVRGKTCPEKRNNEKHEANIHRSTAMLGMLCSGAGLWDQNARGLGAPTTLPAMFPNTSDSNLNGDMPVEVPVDIFPAVFDATDTRNKKPKALYASMLSSLDFLKFGVLKDQN